MIHALAAALTLVLVAANQPPPPVDAPLFDAPPSDTAPAPAPNSAIVGGHHIQPRAGTGQQGTGLTKRDADDVDRLYQELMRQTTPAKSASPQ